MGRIRIIVVGWIRFIGHGLANATARLPLPLFVRRTGRIPPPSMQTRVDAVDPGEPGKPERHTEIPPEQQPGGGAPHR